MTGLLTQTGALFLDAYREINSKKMFWVTLFLSALVVAAFAGVGINERGIKIFVWDFPGIYNTKFISPPTFYKLMFSALGVGWWLNVFAIGLASMNLVLDFDLITKAEAQGVPREYGWLAAFGLVVTLVWLYVEILRLLYLLTGRD